MPLAVCATPIGNLDDVTLRVLAELAAADVVLCEDTRHTRVLLERHGIEARLLSYHEHNEARRTAELLPRLEAGERAALVSDAGLPGVSDPGVRLVRAALAAGVGVTVLPGPSAVETALVVSGLVAEQYRFLGFLPRGEKRLAELWEALRGWPWPAVAFESPHRSARRHPGRARTAPGGPRFRRFRRRRRRHRRSPRAGRRRSSQRGSLHLQRARSRSFSDRGRLLMALLRAVPSQPLPSSWRRVCRGGGRPRSSRGS